MGFFPIFLYLAGFLLLFMMEVANNFRNKKNLYQKSLDPLIAQLKVLNGNSDNFFLKDHSLEEVENHYQSLKINANKSRLEYLNQTVKPTLAKTKLYLYWYNKLIRTKPYSFVARVMGYPSI